MEDISLECIYNYLDAFCNSHPILVHIIGFVSGLLTIIAVPYSIICFLVKCGKKIWRKRRLNKCKFDSTHQENKFLYTEREINQMIYDFCSNINCYETTEQLDGSILNQYKNDMHSFNLLLPGKEKKKITIPYLQIVNFIQIPGVEIKIDSLNLENKLQSFELSDELINSTQVVLDYVKKNKKVTDDPHPRMSLLEKIKGDDNKYVCYFDETHYFTQIRTNLSLDCPIEGFGSLRNIDSQRRGTCSPMTSNLPEIFSRYNFDFKCKGTHPQTLPSLFESTLANVVGVSAIWCLGTSLIRKYYLVPRRRSVGVYENRLGMPSGDTDCPLYRKFKCDNLLDFLKQEIEREFTEETGIADERWQAKDNSLWSRIVRFFKLNDYIEFDSKKLNKIHVNYYTKLEIIPLAFVREMLRGGKPQMFFLIRTKEIDKDLLQQCFSVSLDGRKEFCGDNQIDKGITISTEVACNYLYAQAYLYKEIYLENGSVDVTRGPVQK